MKELMQALRLSSIQAILNADDAEKLETLRVKYLGKKGELTGILRGVRSDGMLILPGDVRPGHHIVEGKKSVAFRLTMRDENQTLTDEHAEEIVRGVLTALKEKYGAEMR